ncbi:MAG: T9SS type A sorting domain-containing protein [Fibrobacteria bacterium]|nr:T9SS type A sorting domain-containing protein [Fibrobacteria bacterium]
MSAIIPLLAATLEQAYLVAHGIPSYSTEEGPQAHAQGWVDVEANGAIHVIYSGCKYRMGPAPDSLGPEETFSTDQNVWEARMSVGYDGTPHVVYQIGIASGAKTSWYTTKKDDNWITPEKIVDADEINVRRAFHCDVAVDSAGNVLVCHWVVGSTDTENAFYRWRSKDGVWGDLKIVPQSNHEGAPKVRELNGKFYLMYYNMEVNPCIAGPAEVGEDFTGGTCANALAISTFLHEGHNFALSADGRIAATGGVRMEYPGPAGIWTAISNDMQSFDSAQYMGDFPNSVRFTENNIHPNLTFDDATGAVVVVGMNSGDSNAYYYVHENNAWNASLQRIYSEGDEMQTCFRTGPSVADIPGRGVIILFRNGNDLYLRKLMTEREITTVSPIKNTNKNSLNQLQMIENGVLSIPSSGSYNVTIRDLNGKVLVKHNRAESKRLSLLKNNIPNGLYIVNLKRVKE